MSKKISGGLLIVILTTVAMILVLYSETGTQEIPESESLKVLHVVFGVSPRTVETFPYAGVRVGVSHRCMVDDELILKKIEIFGGDHRVLIESIILDKPLKSIGSKLTRLDEITREINSLREKLDSLSQEERDRAAELQAEGISLSNQIRSESFSFEIPSKGVDLRTLKETPLVPGDKIPLTLEVYAIHNGEPLLETITKFVEITPKY